MERGTDQETAKGHWPAVRGTREFIEYAHQHSNASAKEVRREPALVSSEKILAAVIQETGGKRADLVQSRRGRGSTNVARSMAMKLCQEQGSMKLSDMAKLFQVGSDSAVSRSISRLNEQMDGDKAIQRMYKRICRDLAPETRP